MALFVRLCILDIYTIPSGSMDRTLVPGDKVVMQKLSYGPLIPRYPGEWPVLSPLFKSFNQGAKGQFKRLRGFSRLKHNDIVVFKYPQDQSVHYIKRCVGLPGETLHITNNDLYTDSLIIMSGQNYLWDFVVDWQGKGIEKAIRESIPRTVLFAYRQWRNAYVLGLTDDEAERFYETNASRINKPQKVVYELKNPSKVWPFDPLIRGSRDNFGPVLIPKKGMCLAISSANIAWYRDVITRFEGNRLEETEKGILVNGQLTDHYTFKMSYYFMMGDNRHHSIDSRHWGFVPEECILGKAWFIIWSKVTVGSGRKQLQWQRFFKSLSAD